MGVTRDLLCVSHSSSPGYGDIEHVEHLVSSRPPPDRSSRRCRGYELAAHPAPTPGQPLVRRARASCTASQTYSTAGLASIATFARVPLPHGERHRADWTAPALLRANYLATESAGRPGLVCGQSGCAATSAMAPTRKAKTMTKARWGHRSVALCQNVPSCVRSYTSRLTQGLGRVSK